MPKTQTKRGLSPRELDALRKQYAAEQRQRESENKWQLANDIASGINDIVGRGAVAPILGAPADIKQALWDAGAWVNNKIKDVEVATGMVKQPRYVPYSQGNAYLGSEDIGNRMEQAGLVSSERRPLTELTASMISPGAAAKSVLNAPKTAMNALRMIERLDEPVSRWYRLSDGRLVPRNQLGAIMVWHGTDVEFGRPNTPLFLGDRPTAEAYARRRADESGFNPILMGGTADFKKIASEDDVKRVAKSVGVVVENNMAFHALDPNINGRHNSQKLIDALKAEGYDSAYIDDFSPDDPFTLTKSYVAFDPDQLNLKPQPGLLGKMVAPQDEALRVAQAESGILGDMVQPQKLKRADIVQRAKALGMPVTGKNEQIMERVQILERDPATWTADDFSKVADYLDIHQDFRGASADKNVLDSILTEGLRSGMSDNLGAMHSKKSYTYGKGLSGGRSFIFPSASIKYKSSSNPWFAPGNKPLFYMDATKGQDIYEAIKSAKRNPYFGNQPVTAPQPGLPKNTGIVWDRQKGIGNVPNQQELDYFGFERNMKPSEFRKYVPKGVWNKDTKSFLASETSKGKTVAPPFLKVEWDKKNKAWRVSNHEGRSRADYSEELNADADIPVSMLPVGMRAKDITPEMRSAPIIGQQNSPSYTEWSSKNKGKKK